MHEKGEGYTPHPDQSTSRPASDRLQRHYFKTFAKSLSFTHHIYTRTSATAH